MNKKCNTSFVADKSALKIEKPKKADPEPVAANSEESNKDGKEENNSNKKRSRKAFKQSSKEKNSE